MKAQLETLALKTSEKQQLINITSEVKELLHRSGIKDGLLGVFSQHTTATLMVSEFQAALLDDVGDFLKQVVEEDIPYRHNCPEFSDCERHNAASHLRSMLFNNAILLPVSDGELVLGQFQDVIFAEMDGPRERSVKVQLLGM